MKPQFQRCFVATLVVTTALSLIPATCDAGLLPVGDVNGKSLDELGLDWIEWGVATGLGGQSLPDTVDGIRYLPPNFGGGEFVADVTVQPGTPLLVSPFFVFGERYDNGTEDNPADPFIETIFQETTIKTSLNGSVVLEGTTSDLVDRRLEVTVFDQPIPYADPQPRGDINAVAALFGTGIVTVFDDLAPGQHTIKNEFDSTIFGTASYTYNITVVPEPAGLGIAGIGALALILGRCSLRARGATPQRQLR